MRARNCFILCKSYSFYFKTYLTIKIVIVFQKIVFEVIFKNYSLIFCKTKIYLRIWNIFNIFKKIIYIFNIFILIIPYFIIIF